MDIDLDNITSFGSTLIHRFKHFQFGTKAQLAFLEDFSVLVNDGIPACGHWSMGLIARNCTNTE